MQASSSEMYGNSKEKLQNENTPFNPGSPYASAKTLGNWTTKNYRNNFNIFASNSIMFNQLKVNMCSLLTTDPPIHRF